jgi:hypothetical protein
LARAVARALALVSPVMTSLDDSSLSPSDPAEPLARSALPAKPAGASLTVWSGVASILSGLTSLAMVLAGALGPEAVGPAVAAVFAGVTTIIGRLRARTVIGG